MELEKFDFTGTNYFYVDSPSWQYTKRLNLSCHCLILVIKGTLYMEMNGTRYGVSKNEVLFIPAGYKSRGYRACDEPTGFYQVIFTAEKFPEFPTRFKVDDVSDACEFFNLLNNTSRNKDYDQKAKNAILYALLYEIYYQLTKDDTEQFPQNISMVDKIKGYINKFAMNRNLSVQDVAHHYGFSAGHMQRLFVAEAHTTIALCNQLNPYVKAFIAEDKEAVRSNKRRFFPFWEKGTNYFTRAPPSRILKF